MSLHVWSKDKKHIDRFCIKCNMWFMYYKQNVQLECKESNNKNKEVRS